MATPAVALLSGGLDSATALALAVAEGHACHALSIDYGQRHRAELRAAEKVARHLGAAEHRIVALDLGWIGGSALTDRRIAVPEAATAEAVREATAQAIPVTYVPARNTIFLALALGYAEVIEAGDIFIGVSAVDYSGYPDCRPEFIRAFAAAARLATRVGAEGRPPAIRAPLIAMSKAQIIQTGARLGVDYALTVSCYQADAAARACGRCDACRLRRQGFLDAGVADPTAYGG